MGYSTQTGETDQPQKGGAFEGGQTSGITTVPQKGGVFDGVVIIDGPTGPAGPAGPPGAPGTTIQVGATATAMPGDTAAVTVVATMPSAGTENLAFAFTLPKGDPGGLGPTGPPIAFQQPTVTTNTIAPNDPASVTVIGTQTGNNETLSFVFNIPRGAAGDLSVGTVTTVTGAAGTQANVVITEQAANPGTFNFAFTIPQGIQGPTGAAGTAATVTVGPTITGAPGTQASVAVSGTPTNVILTFTIPQGAQGAQGATGPQGAAGRGVVSVTAGNAVVAAGYATVTLTETFTDNTTATTTFNFPTGNNFTSGTGNPTSAPLVIPGLYLNVTDKSLWAYLTVSWIEVGGGTTTTIVTNADGTITASNLGNNDFDVKIARQNANDGQFLAWNTASNKWVPKTPDVSLSNNNNNFITLSVENSTPSTIPIVNRVNVVTAGNLMSVDVNGVDAVDANIVNSNALTFAQASGQLVSIVNGVPSNPVNIVSAGLNSVALVEPTWRTVTTAASGGIQTLTVTDNEQAPTRFFAGTTAPVYSYDLGLNIGVSTAQSRISIITDGIDGVFGVVSFVPRVGLTPNAAYLEIQNPPGSSWYNQVIQGGTNVGNADFWQAFQPMGATTHTLVYQAQYNGTRNPIHTSGPFFLIEFLNFSGGSTGNTQANVSPMLSGTAGAPAFRDLNISDIEPLFTGTYPTDNTVATWNNGLISWNLPTAVSTTSVSQGNGITVTPTTMGANTNYQVTASLIAQDNSVVQPGTFYTINAGTNMTATVLNGVLTLNASGGSSGSGFGLILPAWGTGSVSSKQAYMNATGPTQGAANPMSVTIRFLQPAANVQGQITAATVSFNGIAATGTYATTSVGTFPNTIYTMSIPVGDIPAAAQTTASVLVSVVGTYDLVQMSFAAGTLINTQPQPSTGQVNTSVLNPAARAYYAPAGFGTITAIATPTNNGLLTNVTFALDTGARQAGGVFNNVALGLYNVNAMGLASGTLGAPINVPYEFNGPATVSQATFVPAFYLQTLGSAIPTFTTNSTQTTGAGMGSTIVYPPASATTQYNWLLTDRPIANVKIMTPFGNQPVVPDVNTTYTIAGTTMVLNLFGFTTLTVNRSVTLIIS